ncbi:MFS transporter, partial [Streptomyces albidoflavus]
SSVVGPIYIAEIAPAKNRGRLTGLFQFMIVLGIYLAYLHIPINLTPFRQFQIDPQSCCLKKAEVVVQKGILELIF